LIIFMISIIFISFPPTCLPPTLTITHRKVYQSRLPTCVPRPGQRQTPLHGVLLQSLHTIPRLLKLSHPPAPPVSLLHTRPTGRAAVTYLPVPLPHELTLERYHITT
jgi:hypothetical protein